MEQIDKIKHAALIASEVIVAEWKAENQVDLNPEQNKSLVDLFRDIYLGILNKSMETMQEINDENYSSYRDKIEKMNLDLDSVVDSPG